MSDFATMGAQMGMNFFEGKLAFEREKELQERSYKMQQKLQDKTFELNQAERRMAPLMSVEAMERAGLSPSLMTDGKFQLAGMSTPSAPSAHASLQNPMNLAALKNAESQASLADSQAELALSQSEKVDAETERIKTEDNQWKRNFESWLSETMDNPSIPQSVKDLASEALEISDTFTKGTFEALEGYIQLRQDDRQSLLNRIDNKIQLATKQILLANGYSEAQANNEFVKFAKASQEVLHLMADTSTAQSQTALNYSLAQKTHDTNIVGLLRDGDAQAIVGKILSTAIEAGLASSGVGLVALAGKKLVGAIGKKVFKGVAKDAVEDVPEKVVKKRLLKPENPNFAKVQSKPKLEGIDKVKDDADFVDNVLRRSPLEQREKAYWRFIDATREGYKGSFADFLKKESREATARDLEKYKKRDRRFPHGR